MSSRLSFSATTLVLCLATGPASACGPEPYIGQVCTFAFDYCPRGYLPADGRVVSISQNTALFSLLGVLYGGDGRTTFGLPDLRGRAVVGAGGASAQTSPVALGQMRGQEAVSLLANQLPQTPVSVAVQVSQNNGSKAVATAGDLLAVSNANGRGQPMYVPPADAGNQVALGGVQATLEGEGKPVPTLPPELGLTQCIATDGLFPPRP